MIKSYLVQELLACLELQGPYELDTVLAVLVRTPQEPATLSILLCIPGDDCCRCC